jgi:hypothetical protein
VMRELALTTVLQALTGVAVIALQSRVLRVF